MLRCYGRFGGSASGRAVAEQRGWAGHGARAAATRGVAPSSEDALEGATDHHTITTSHHRSKRSCTGLGVTARTTCQHFVKVNARRESAACKESVAGKRTPRRSSKGARLFVLALPRGLRAGSVDARSASGGLADGSYALLSNLSGTHS